MLSSHIMIGFIFTRVIIYPDFLLVPSLLHAAVTYLLEADADYRKNGLIPRATFPEASASNISSAFSGTVSIDGKGKEQCVRRKLSIPVTTLIHFALLLL